jgi:ER membrane protein complex subunit 7
MAIGTSVKGFGLAMKTSNTKLILNGGQRVTFARPDDYFALYPTKDALP